MDARERETLVAALGPEDAAAVERFLSAGCALCALVEAADSAESDWPEWGRAAAVLQRWLEERQRDADVTRKLGYLHCTYEALKPVPPTLRPSLPQAVARMLKDHGFAED